MFFETWLDLAFKEGLPVATELRVSMRAGGDPAGERGISRTPAQ
jgi:hypothetical protein